MAQRNPGAAEKAEEEARDGTHEWHVHKHDNKAMVVQAHPDVCGFNPGIGDTDSARDLFEGKGCCFPLFGPEFLWH